MVRALLVALVCLPLALAAATHDAHACAPAPPAGEEVQTADEEAIIVWDPATRTEHFIRRAQFRSTARAFGFLVPTPTTPALGEIDARVFDTLADRIQPEIVEHGAPVAVTSLLFEACMLSAGKSEESAGAMADTATAPVRVLATARVAGFDAITVEADDPRALTAWLGQHGFATTPELTAWLARYVADKWKLTAFVIASDQAEASERQYTLATRVVRMTFATDRPFYPYREPAEPAEPAPQTSPVEVPAPRFRSDDRLLRVHFLSTERYAATLAGAPWSARVLFSAPLPSGVPELAGLGDHLRHSTVFIDDSSPRRAIDELFFAPSADRAEVRQPPITVPREDVIMIPVDAIAILLLGVLWFYLRRRRRRAPAAAPPPAAA